MWEIELRWVNRRWVASTLAGRGNKKILARRRGLDLVRDLQWCLTHQQYSFWPCSISISLVEYNWHLITRSRSLRWQLSTLTSIQGGPLESLFKQHWITIHLLSHKMCFFLHDTYSFLPPSCGPTEALFHLGSNCLHNKYLLCYNSFPFCTASDLFRCYLKMASAT